MRTIQSWATRIVVVGERGHEICDSVKYLRGTYHYYIPEIEIFLDYRSNLQKGKDFEDESG
jgi:hypothetical protein